jgi:hypothetical protein
MPVALQSTALPDTPEPTPLTALPPATRSSGGAVMAVPALLFKMIPLSRAEFERVVRATLPVASSRADAEECALDAQFDILTKEIDNQDDILGLAIHISRNMARNLHRKRRDHPQVSLEAIEEWGPIKRREDPRTFFLWPGSDPHIDLLAIGEDGGARHSVALEIAELQARGETDYIGLHRSFREWDRETIIDALREFGEHKGSAPIARDLELHDSLPSRCIIYKHFRSWSGAVEAAGFQPERPGRSYSRWGREEARKAFCEWVTRHKRIPSKHDVALETATMPSRSTLERVFGTGGMLRLSVEINRLCLDAGCRHDWQPGKPVKPPTHSL